MVVTYPIFSWFIHVLHVACCDIGEKTSAISRRICDKLQEDDSHSDNMLKSILSWCCSHFCYCFFFFLFNKSCHTNVFTPIVQIAESQSVEDNGQAFQQVRFVLMLFVSVVHCFVCILLFL